jgi:hypothetical protein
MIKSENPRLLHFQIKAIATLLFGFALTGAALLLFPDHPDPTAAKLPALALLTATAATVLFPWPHSRAVWLMVGFQALCLGRWFLSPIDPSLALAAWTTLFAFMLGTRGQPRPSPFWIIPGLSIVMAMGLADFFTLQPLSGAWVGPTSLFASRHDFAGMLLLGLFWCFYRLEVSALRGGPLPLVGYALTLATLTVFLLAGSASALIAFFLILLALVFASVRLDFAEPKPERLLWVTLSTLIGSMILLHLPDSQWQWVSESLQQGTLPQAWRWESAWSAFQQHPFWGWGSVPLQDILIAPIQLSASLPEFKDAVSIPFLHSRLFQVALQNGLLGWLVEGLLWLSAITGFYHAATAKQNNAARFAGAAFVALSLHGLFSPALEREPLRLAYFCLMGYGVSFRKPSRNPSRSWGKIPHWAPRLIIAGLAPFFLYPLWMEFRKVRADADYGKAMTFARTDKKAFTNGLVKLIEREPWHPEANLAYAQILSENGRWEDGLYKLERLETHARVSPAPLAITRSLLLLAAGRLTSS